MVEVYFMCFGRNADISAKRSFFVASLEFAIELLENRKYKRIAHLI